MRVLLSIFLLTALQVPVVLADIQPTAASILGTAGKLMDPSIAVPSVGAPENFPLRVFSMCVGILLFGLAAFLALKPKTAPVKVSVREKGDFAESASR